MTNAAIPNGRGWYPDPFSKGELLRQFDGARWTDQTRPMPADYDATHATDGQKSAQKSESEKKADDAAPRANPTKAPALEKSHSAPAPKKEPAKGKPARNGTAPMFSTPTEKAATSTSSPKEGTQAPAPRTAPEPPKKAAGGPAFASPTVRAERPDEDQNASPKVAAPTTPTSPAKPESQQGKEAAPAFNFAKPANGSDPSPTQSAPNAPEPQTAAPTPSPEQEPSRPQSSGPAGPGSVDADPEEDSETVTNAFANVPQEPTYSSEAVEDALPASDRRGFGGRGRQAIRGAMGNAKIVTWVVVALLAVSAIVVPLLVPSPVRGVAAECRPISDVVVAYDGASDFTITKESQAKLASAVSTGEIDEELTKLVTTAVEKDDMKPVVDRCLPQES